MNLSRSQIEMLQRSVRHPASLPAPALARSAGEDMAAADRVDRALKDASWTIAHADALGTTCRSDDAGARLPLRRHPGRLERADRREPVRTMTKNDDLSGSPGHSEANVTGDACPSDGSRDRMILEHLLSGDSRALATLLLEGHVPGPAVRQCLALMLLDWPEADALVAQRPALNQGVWQLPFRLVAKARPRKRARRASENNERSDASLQTVTRRVGELQSDAAFARVDEAVLALIKSGQEKHWSDRR
jgi:hypothetical protein